MKQNSGEISEEVPLCVKRKKIEKALKEQYLMNQSNG
jgi:hypothetical protein